MPLESLLALVEKLRKRIDVHGPALRQSEALTRYALIDPLLRELGWDTENPDLVVPEYQTDDGRPDYALFSDGKPIMMVEAKKLGTALQGKVIRQGIGYCLEQGTLYFSVTDGRLWKIYETHRSVPIDEKRVVEFDLKNQSAAEACLKALTLWGLRVSGQVAPGQIPVVGPTHNQLDSLEPSTPSPQPTPPSPDEETAEQDANEQTIVENLQRVDISPLEQATAYQRMMECYGYDEKTLAKRLGIRQWWRIRERTSLLKLRPKYQQLLRAKQLTRNQAYEMSRLEPRNQDVLFRSISTGKLTTYEALRAAATALVEQE